MRRYIKNGAKPYNRGSGFRSPKFTGSINLSILVPVIIVGAIVILFKPLSDFFKKMFGNIGGGLDNLAGAGNSLLQFLNIKDTPAEISIKTAASNPLSPWSPNMWKDKAAPAGTKLLTVADAAVKCAAIRDCVGFFNDDEDRAISIFKSLRTQSQVSFLADQWAKIYKSDMLTWLNGDWFNDRLKGDCIAIIDSYVLKLPKFK